MTAIDRAALDQWYCVGALGSLEHAVTQGVLMQGRISIQRMGDEFRVESGAQVLNHRVALGHLWVSPGMPKAEVLALPEAFEPDRRHVPCGAVVVRSSGPRVIENFLDMAHFPFVHTDILGAEPHTEVAQYDCEIRRDVDEVWATDCSFVQPKAALSAAGAIDTRYMYRVFSPLGALLYKTCPNAPDRWDVIAVFVQPLAPDLCRAHMMMYLVDDISAQRDLIGFQQMIFLQDRIIVENQRPRLLPLEPRAEVPTRADASSIAYRRWLKEKGFCYGTTLGPEGIATA